MTNCTCSHSASEHLDASGCVYCTCVKYELPTRSLLCTVCNFHPVTISLAPGKELCDRCAQAAVQLLDTPTNIVTRMEKRGILDTFSLDAFRSNNRTPGIESPVIVMEYETAQGSQAYCGFATLIPGCRTVQKTLGQAYQMCAMVAEAVDLRKS